MPNDITVTKITTSGSEKWDVAYTTDAAYPAGSPLIKTLNTAGTLLDRNIQIAITTPAGSATVAGGGLSVESNYTGTPAVSIALDSQTTSGITINDTQPSSGYYLKLIGSSSALTGTTQVSRAPITLARTAGWVTAQSATNVLNSTDSNPTVTVNSGSKTRYLAIPTATFTTSGATVYCSGAGWVPAGSASSGIGTVSAGTITNNTTLPSGSTSSGNLNYQKYIKISAGYYPSDLYYYNGVGAINGSIGGSPSNGSATAVLTNTNNINTIADISGKTAGTDYWAIKATATTSAGSYTPKYTVTTPGYLGSTVTGTAQTVSVTADSIGTSIYIPKAIYSTSAGVTTITTAGYLPANTKVTNITTQTPTTNYANSGLDDYFSAGSSSDYDVSITPRYSNSAGYVAAHTNTNNGGIGYWKIKTTSRSAGNGTATLTVNTGDSANSSNTSMSMVTTTPSSGVYYTLTATGKGTVSTGTGWVESGSTTSNIATTYGYITKSVHGTTVAGSLPNSISNRTSGTYQDIEIQPYGYLKIPAGYNPIDRYVYANQANEASEANQASNYSLSVSSISGSNTVTVGTLANGYYPLTANNLSVTATLTAGTAGWFSSGSATDSDTDGVTVGKIAAGSCTVAGGVLSTSGFSKSDLALTLSGDTANTTMTENMTVGAQDTTNYPYYIKISGSTPAVNGTTSASVTAITDAHTAGYIPAKTATNFRNAQSASPSVSVNATSNNTYVNIKAATGTTTISGTTTKQPSITRSAFTISGVTDAASGAATTTAPTSGVYVKVGSAANTGTLTATTATTAGYTPANNSYATKTATVGASASAATYIPITTANPAFDGGAISGSVTGITGSNVTLSDTNNGISVTGAASAGRAAVLYNGAVNGWVSKADNETALSATSSNTTLTGKTRYITEIIVPNTTSFTLTTAAGTQSTGENNYITTVTNNGYRTMNLVNKGWLNIDHTTTSGKETIDAYLADGTTKSGAQTVVGGSGKWNITTVTPNVSGDNMGPYYGAVYVKPMSEGTAAVLTSSGTASAITTVSPGTVSIAANTSAIVGKTRIALTPSTTTSGISKYYAAFKATAAANPTGTTSSISGISYARVSTAGYASTSLTASGLISGTARAKTSEKNSNVYYTSIPTGVLSPSVSVTNGSASIAATGMTTTTTATNYYVTLSTSAGSATPTASVTTNGYVTNEENKTASSATSVNVSGNGNKIYIPALTITAAGGDLTNTTAAATLSSGFITDSADNYANDLTILAQGTAGRAAVTYTNTAGYFPAHTSAQTFSESIPASTWNGTTYYIKGVKLTAPSSGIKKFDITVPNGNTTDFITFQFQVDASGNVFVMGPN